jgi:hypothetical protein
MMKKLRLTFAFVTSLLAGLALPQAGSAQFFDRPQFLEPVLPIDEILYAVEARGFEPISRPRLSGDVYVVEVIDRRGRRARLSVDAFDGMILGSVRPRGVMPDPVYRDARPLVPFGGRPLFRDGYEERFVPDRSVRDLRDPSTRGSSVRIERAPIRPGTARAMPLPPESAPLPPPRPPEVAMAPALGPALPPASERAAPAQQAPEPAALPQGEALPREEVLPRADRPEVNSTAPAREPPLTRRRPATEPVASPPEPTRRQTRQVERQVERQIERQAATPVPQQVERAPPPRAESLLHDFSPDERDQLDLYVTRPGSR